ncbi:MAG: thiamine ABC transporter substrate-binding protein [Candidatus Cloacimonetes bacterium]|nr:thiamine ABC transporter substrate-binding protein [Candidatus Cloacimonadota bacterium]MDY0367205.1 thiamine ABC transporter substrate-binding protein [Candidatus Syntrophosphaera sp.]
MQARKLIPAATAVTLALLLACGDCKPKPEPKAEKPAPTSSLTIFALQHIRSSGFEAAVLKDFGAKNNTALNVVIFPDLISLMDSLSVSDSLANADLVLGLDSSFAISDTILDPFAALPEIALSEISHEIPRDPDQRLIPYASANLSFICDTRKFPDPPRSFGELQDARYFNQLALCDPSATGLGRASLLWTVALFGERGYEQLWNSFRKNVRHLYADHHEALNALRKGDCGLMIGYNSVPAWISEFYPSESHIQAVIPQEGSFRHTEYAALCKGAANRATALLFLRHLISAETQQFVMFKLAMLPVNGRTPLPRGFARVPWSVYSVNSRLDRYEAAQNLPLWLENWDRLIKSLPGL